MAGDASALVLVLPGDTVDSIIAKVRETGATTIQLLVPDGLATLQALGSFARLHQALDDDQIEALWAYIRAHAYQQ